MTYTKRIRSTVVGVESEVAGIWQTRRIWGTMYKAEGGRVYGIAYPTFIEASGAMTATFIVDVFVGPVHFAPDCGQVATMPIHKFNIGIRNRPAYFGGDHGPLVPNLRTQVRGLGYCAPARGRTRRNAEPGQCTVLEAAVPNHRGWACGPRDPEEGMRGKRA